METWSNRHIQDRLTHGEELEIAFPVRYPIGPLPFGVLLRGCIIALTDRRITAFAYSKVAGRPAGEIWSEQRSEGCSATLSANGRRLTLAKRTGTSLELAVSPKHRAEIDRFIAALAE